MYDHEFGESRIYRTLANATRTHAQANQELRFSVRCARGAAELTAVIGGAVELAYRGLAERSFLCNDEEINGDEQPVELGNGIEETTELVHPTDNPLSSRGTDGLRDDRTDGGSPRIRLSRVVRCLRADPSEASIGEAWGFGFRHIFLCVTADGSVS